MENLSKRDGCIFSVLCLLLTEEVQMKTECNDLDEKAAVRNFIFWAFVLKWDLIYAVY